MGPIGPRRAEIKQRLITTQGITGTEFPKMIAGTRFNLKYLISISDRIGETETFRMEKVLIHKLTLAGGPSQIIVTKPEPDTSNNMNWKECSVQTESADCASIAQIGAAYVFGFQLYKESAVNAGVTVTANAQTWSCIDANTAVPNPWTIPAAWYENRNARRALPPGIGSMRFRGNSKSQDETLYHFVRRMVKTNR